MADDAQQIADPLQPPKPKFGKQQIIATILTLIVLIIVFVVVLPQFGDYSAAWEAIQNMTAWQLGLIAAATVGLIILYVFPYSAAMPGLRYKHGFYTRQTSFMISNVIPGGGAWGLAVQYGMLSSYGYGPAPTTAVIGITSVWNTLVTLSLPLLAIVGLTITGQTGAEDVALTVVAALLVVVMIGGLALILRSEALARRIGGWGNAVIGWGAGIIHKEVSFDAAEALVDFRVSIIDVVADRWVLVTAANVGQQLAQFSILYLAVVALQGGFDGSITLAEAFAAFALGRLATFIPIPPGGLGTTDAIITSMLAGFGMSQNDALAATLVWRAFTYFPQVIIGVITLLLWRRDSAKKALST
ncbi:MAG: YbhN family protein [Acidimicrobiia bacterium]|nr:YbhN family protein [Acidimicrobiia bacterium]